MKLTICANIFALLFVFGLGALAVSAAAAQVGDRNAVTAPQGKEFACTDGSKMVLDFRPATDGVDALVSVHGELYRLPAQPPLPGVPQVVWSDGENSLTWSTGVHLMWMGPGVHVMCGRSHSH